MSISKGLFSWEWNFVENVTSSLSVLVRTKHDLIIKLIR
jgi:hypothetical protein